MIPRDYVTAWRTRAPWVQDSQVEQDLILSRALVEIFSHPVLAEGLAMRGGTAIYKLYFQPPARYSEDIDLVQIEAGPAGPLMDALREALNPWLGAPSVRTVVGAVVGPAVLTRLALVASCPPGWFLRAFFHHLCPALE